MKIVQADVVSSLNGRDAGKRFIVIGIDGEYSLLADGKGRRVEKPKRKKNKHVKPEGRRSERIASMLAEGGKVTNSEVRRALQEHAADTGQEGGTDEAAAADATTQGAGSQKSKGTGRKEGT
jgi:ribosomal protein L14E/L6E/L27E